MLRSSLRVAAAATGIAMLVFAPLVRAGPIHSAMIVTNPM